MKCSCRADLPLKEQRGSSTALEACGAVLGLELPVLGLGFRAQGLGCRV